MDDEMREQALLDEESAALLDEDEPDALEEMIAEATACNPQFPDLVAAARRRRDLIDALVALRRAAHVTQADLARRMATSQAAVARLEAGEIDPRLSTLQRYAASLGKRVTWQITEG